jgi:hypothetical protein
MIPHRAGYHERTGQLKESAALQLVLYQGHSWCRVLVVPLQMACSGLQLLCQQTMTEPNGTLLKEEKIVAVTKIFMKLLNVIGH